MATTISRKNRKAETAKQGPTRRGAPTAASAKSMGPAVPGHGIPPLENGARLTATEFLRRFEAMPELKKAELINGIVYMASPVRSNYHGEPDSLLQTWLGTYAIATPGTRSSTNATARLGPDDVPQPDACLRLLNGGQAALDEKGYLAGPPEFVAEIAASSKSIDAGAKRDSYRRFGVLEYLVWRTEDAELDWWVLEDDAYVPRPADRKGILRSRAFPGLWLRPEALLAMDGTAVMKTLHAGLASKAHRNFAAALASPL